MSAVDEAISSRTDKLVIVGSSAGGIEALTIFVATLPANFPAPIVLAQHLDPNRPSLLGTLLKKRTTLPVNVITAHTALQSGEIYVIPPDCYVTIHDGYIEMNVLSYFTSDLQEFVLNRLTFSLFPGGYLFLGKAETVHPPQALYECVSKEWNVYRCIGNAFSAAQLPDGYKWKKVHLEMRSRGSPVRTAVSQRSEQQVPLPTFEPGQAGHFNELLLCSLPIGIVVIDRT